MSAKDVEYMKYKKELCKCTVLFYLPLFSQALKNGKRKALSVGELRNLKTE